LSPNEYNDAEFIKLREKVHELEVEVARLQEQEKAADRALVIANKALEHSQASSNEWRKENIDQRATYPTISKVDGQFSTESSERRSLENRIILLEKSGSADQGKHSAFDVVWVRAAVVISMLLTAIGLAYKFVTGK
jgi:hypothetical protein